MSTHSSLLEVFVKVLDLPDDVDPVSLNYRETSSWNSLAHMEIVQSVENVFGVSLSVEEVIGFSSFAQGLEILAEHGLVDG
ncbi:hypothetical protein BLA60_03690 [Actinophytocola xinjiangensis]|uniref:Carrier domain-containing protein n=1 Tax=Actinophytocola xinjiangensis TaxID=485602 RepID=A0A7Z0WSU8_9PSEU|nr:acyl carrier protein [Actinophytocola xinjiangensis]OLF14247.1 hypothetical protein BLA60_03690 [Actinophytocola xinjiangensis]